LGKFVLLGVSIPQNAKLSNQPAAAASEGAKIGHFAILSSRRTLRRKGWGNSEAIKSEVRRKDGTVQT
jgi:hypothetical protein